MLLLQFSFFFFFFFFFFFSFFFFFFFFGVQIYRFIWFFVITRESGRQLMVGRVKDHPRQGKVCGCAEANQQRQIPP